jgi:hypothetical protein
MQHCANTYLDTLQHILRDGKMPANFEQSKVSTSSNHGIKAFLATAVEAAEAAGIGFSASGWSVVPVNEMSGDPVLLL